MGGGVAGSILFWGGVMLWLLVFVRFCSSAIHIRSGHRVVRVQMETYLSLHISWFPLYLSVPLLFPLVPELEHYRKRHAPHPTPPPRSKNQTQKKKKIRWRKTSGDFVALWGKLRETSAYARCTSALTASSNAATAPMDGGGLRSAGYGYGGGGHNASSSQYRNVGTIGAASSSSTAARLAAAGGSGVSRGDLADGCAALERDLERMGVPAAGGGGGASYAATGRQMWEFKAVNKDYALSRTYPQVCVCVRVCAWAGGFVPSRQRVQLR